MSLRSGGALSLGEMQGRAKRADGHVSGEAARNKLRKARESVVLETAIAWFQRTGASLNGWPKNSPGHDLAEAVIALLDVDGSRKGSAQP